jgi:hypothetical protein
MIGRTGLGVQDLAAALLALLALAWLVRRAVRRKARATPFCGECPGCATGSEHAAAGPDTPHDGFVPLSQFGGRGAVAPGGGNARPATR